MQDEEENHTLPGFPYNDVDFLEGIIMLQGKENL